MKDKQMTVLINKKEIKFFNFSGGECQVSVDDIPLGAEIEVTAYLHNADDIMRLLLTIDAIRRIKGGSAHINLVTPYIPYARQDRVCNNGEALSIAVMAGLINNLGCARVTILDPHSDVTPALIRNAHIITQAQLIADSAAMCALIRDKSLTLIAPDAGAEKKIGSLEKALHTKGINALAMFATKRRDVRNGTILETIIPANVAGKNFLIADDICDGGKTFTELAAKLKEHGAHEIYLYVTHGIFSKGLDVLKTHISHIYCFHSFIKNTDSSFLTILEDVSCV